MGSSDKIKIKLSNRHLIIHRKLKERKLSIIPRGKEMILWHWDKWNFKWKGSYCWTLERRGKENLLYSKTGLGKEISLVVERGRGGGYWRAGPPTVHERNSSEFEKQNIVAAANFCEICKNMPPLCKHTSQQYALELFRDKECLGLKAFIFIYSYKSIGQYVYTYKSTLSVQYIRTCAAVQRLCTVLECQEH